MKKSQMYHDINLKLRDRFHPVIKAAYIKIEVNNYYKVYRLNPILDR